MAARPLKIIAVVALLLVAVGGAALYWAFSQATALPDWYTADGPTEAEADTDDDPQWVAITTGEEPSEDPFSQVDEAPDAASAPSLPENDDDGRPAAEEPRQPTPKKTGKKAGKARKNARRYVLRGFHRRKRNSKKSAVKASRAVLEDGKLEAGVILDLSRVPKDDLNARDRDLYRKAVEGFPGITRRDVYVGIEDRPVTRDGVLQLGPNPQIRVGNLRYSLDKAAGKLGMSPAQLRREFDRELRRMKLEDPTAG